LGVEYWVCQLINISTNLPAGAAVQAGQQIK
jgi:hypothetical protein